MRDSRALMNRGSSDWGNVGTGGRILSDKLAFHWEGN